MKKFGYTGIALSMVKTLDGNRVALLLNLILHLHLNLVLLVLVHLVTKPLLHLDSLA